MLPKETCKYFMARELCSFNDLWDTAIFLLFFFFFNILLFYFYNFKQKIQSRTPKLSVLPSHSFMIYTCADNFITYGFHFFIGIRLIQTF